MDLKAQGTSLPMQIFKQSPSVWSLEGRPCHFGFLLVFWDLVALLVSVAGGQRTLLHLTTFTCSVSQIVFYVIYVWLFSHCWFFFWERLSRKAHLHYCKPQFIQSWVALHCQYELGRKKKKYRLTKRAFICPQEKNPNFFELVIADYNEAYWFHVKYIELWNSLSVPTCYCSCRQRSVQRSSFNACKGSFHLQGWWW